MPSTPHPKFRTPRPRRAFTLIELLVVVTLIVLLLSVLLPTIGSSIEMSRRTRCASNLKQLALAGTTYASDNFGRFVVRDQATQPSLYAGGFHDDAQVFHWGRLFQGYIPNLDFDGHGSPLFWDPSIDNPGNGWLTANAFWRCADYSYWPSLDTAIARIGGAGIQWVSPRPTAQSVQTARTNSAFFGDEIFQFQQGTFGWFVVAHPVAGGGANGWNSYLDNIARTDAPMGGNQANVDGAVIWASYAKLEKASWHPAWGADGNIAYQYWQR